MEQRTFPAPWRVDITSGGIVKDAHARFDAVFLESPSAIRQREGTYGGGERVS
jgi:hypothetical protein